MLKCFGDALISRNIIILIFFFQAHEEALANVQQFLDHRKEGISKNLWDRISTVYDFPKDERNLDLYSNLHEWAKEERRQSPSTDRNENIEKKFDLEMNSLQT